MILKDETLIKNIYDCNILPLTRDPLDNYDVPFQEDGKTPAVWFQELDFSADPIAIQPTLCLVNWLRARGVDVHPSRSSRHYIEQSVMNCLRVKNKLSDNPF